MLGMHFLSQGRSVVSRNVEEIITSIKLTETQLNNIISFQIQSRKSYSVIIITKKKYIYKLQTCFFTCKIKIHFLNQNKYYFSICVVFEFSEK